MLVRGESVLAPTDPRSKRTDEPAESVYSVEGISAVIREYVSVDEGCSSKGMFDGGRGGLSCLGRWCHQHKKRPPLDRRQHQLIARFYIDQRYTSRGRVPAPTLSEYEHKDNSAV